MQLMTAAAASRGLRRTHSPFKGLSFKTRNYTMCALAVSDVEKPSAVKNPGRKPRIALICDLAEENWESMDLVALMLEQGLAESGHNVEAFRLRPAMRRRFTKRDSGKP